MHHMDCDDVWLDRNWSKRSPAGLLKRLGEVIALWKINSQSTGQAKGTTKRKGVRQCTWCNSRIMQFMDDAIHGWCSSWMMSTFKKLSEISSSSHSLTVIQWRGQHPLPFHSNNVYQSHHLIIWVELSMSISSNISQGEGMMWPPWFEQLKRKYLPTSMLP